MPACPGVRVHKGQGGASRGSAVRSDGKGTSKQRLRSWKEIAGFFGTDERTVKRWAAARGLPVRRVPGGMRTPVYADVAELEEWLAQSRAPVPSPAAEAPARPPSRRSSRLVLGGALACALVAAAGLFVWPGPLRDAVGAGRSHQPPQEAVDLYLAGMLHWEKRSPQSLKQAADYFSAALARDPHYAEAYAGLANSYLLMREFAQMPDAQAYPLAEAAARRALDLDPRLPQAHSALAFATFYWGRDFERGRRGFERAVALDPDSAHARHWYATALLHIGDLDAALEQFDEAQRLDPDSPSILADKGLALFLAGRSREAVALLTQLTRLEPDFLSPHAYLATIHLAEGRDAAFLEETRVAARLRGEADRLKLIEEARAAHAAGGRRAMLATFLAAETSAHAAGRESAYTVAGTHALLSEKEAALRYLAASVARREPVAVGLRVNPFFRSLRSDPAYRALAESIGRPVRSNARS